MAAINARDLTAFGEVLADDYIQHASGAQPGPAGVKALFAGFFARMPDLRAEVADLVAEGDRVFARTLTTATISGRPVRGEMFDLWRVKDGRLAEHWGPPATRD